MIVLLTPVVACLFTFSNCAAQTRPVRNTTAGLIAGYFYKEEDIVAEVFEAVPYAQPPVGHLRFELPVPVEPWEGELDGGRGRMPWCVQFWYPDKRLDVRKWKEDCLYATIAVPHNHSSKVLKKPFPVLVWIHGGSYQVNGANMYPISGTVKNLVSEGQVVILVNYRLGPLGFLSALHPELAGNFGLEDMILALKWVKENAALFDGDPNHITVGGESAGAASVSLLASSPRGKGLFHRVIMRSGSAMAPWAVRSKNTDLNSLLMIRWSGCGDLFDSENGVPEVKRCMKSIPVKRLLEIWQIIGNQDLLYVISGKKQPPHNYNHPFLAHTYFTPVVDAFRLNDSIIPTYPYDMIRHNAHVPAMIGATTGECSAYVTWLHFLVSVKQKDVDVNLNDLEFVVPSIIYSNAEQVKQAVYKRYIGDYLWQAGFDFGRALVNIASDQNFISPAVQEARLYAQNNLTVYTYIFNHRNEELERKQLGYGLEDVGTGHGHDMVYLLESTSVVDPIGVSLNWTSADREITNFLKASIFNFSAFGNPSGINKTESSWGKFEGQNGQALIIDLQRRMGGFFEGVASFWQDTVPTIEALTLYRGYQYFPSPPCTDICQRLSNAVDYRLPFFVLLGCSVLLLIAFTVTVCLSGQRRKESSYSLSTPLT